MIANFAVTYRCDGRCSTCRIWRAPPGNELTLQEIEEFFHDNSGHLNEVKSMQLTGGEPFLRTDLPDIVDTVEESLPGCTYWIPTNGLSPDTVASVTEDILQRLHRGRLGVSVSIDGLRETHDLQRGIEGSHGKAVETLSRLAELRIRQPRLMLSVGLTLTPGSLKESPLVQRMAYAHGADFSFRPVNVSDIYYKNQSPDEKYDNEELYKTLRALAKNMVDHKGVLRSLTTLRYIQGVQEYVETGRRTTPCTACTDSFFLDPYGDVYPCIVMNSRLGNIRDKSFIEIWESERAEDARDRISRLECPTCWVECEAYRDIAKGVGEKVRLLADVALDKRNLGLRPYPSLLMM